jgi:hypothetical protein
MYDAVGAWMMSSMFHFTFNLVLTLPVYSSPVFI